MKRIELNAYGVPEDVALCADAASPGAPGPDEVLFDVLAFPINPADVSFCKGNYRLKPPMPATPGAECVGRIAAVGSAVTHLAQGQLVINLQRENWAQQRRVKAVDVIALPAGIDLAQAAMVRINPPTAKLLLSDIVDLKAGDWIIQNVGNSAVGKLVIHFARTRGLRTLSVVRREDAFAELLALGVDACIIDGDDLDTRAAVATGGAPIRLGLDAVSGAACARIAACVADVGTVCNYGAMSGEAATIGTADTIYRGVTLTGFMLGRFLARRSYQEIAALYTEIAKDVAAGKIHAPVEKIYPIERIRDALIHVQRDAKGGKILVAPNGPL